jgi:beta-lactamase regulating signal transducer with metallopeptidase domain
MSTRLFLELVLAIAVRVTVILGVAGLAYLIASWRRASAAHRHLIWSIAIVASLAVPLFGSVLPPLLVPIPQALRRTTDGMPGKPLGKVAAAPFQPTAGSALDAPPVVIHSAPQQQPTTRSRSASFSFAEGLLALYVAGVLVLLAGIVRDHWLLSRLTREAKEISDDRWLASLKSLAARADVRRRVKLLRAGAPIAPLTAGIMRPVIVVPASAEEWPSHRREGVLLHELAHVARHDCLTQTLAALACTLYWPHPLVWLAAARLRVDRELACDDAVLARGMWAREYARDLLDLARGLSAPVPKLAVSMAGVRELEGRLRSLIDDARSRRAPSRATMALAIAGASVAGLIAAIVRPAPVAAALPLRAPLAAVSPAVAPSQFGGQFAIRLTNRDDGPKHQGLVHVMLWTPGINTFYSEMRELVGLTREQLLMEESPVKFVLRRDAGTLEFAGVARHGTGEGRFGFRADTTFNRALADRGIEAVTPEEQFSFARHNLTLDFLDELAKLGYATPTRAELIVAATSGADLAYLREMSALGYRAQSLSGLVALSNEGVDPAFVRRMAAIGYRGLPVRDLLQLRNEDIDSSFIVRENARAGRSLSVGELVLLRMNGGGSESAPPAVDSAPATASFVDDTVVTGRWALRTLRDGALQLDIEWANVNQWRRVIRFDDLTDLRAGDFAAGFDRGRFRMEQEAGVFNFEGRFAGGAGNGDFSFAPNKGFLATLRSLGVRDADRVGIHQLKNLAFGFMSADSVRALMAEGLTPLRLNEVVDLAVYQITPEFVRQAKAEGYTDLTLRRLVDLKLGARVSKSAGGDLR